MICGLDEAGRGPLAGPVYAAAVILDDNFPVEILNDSKKISEKKRSSVASIIYEKAVCFGIGFADHNEIDKINILQASLLSMNRAFCSMLKKMPLGFEKKITRIIVDGLYVPKGINGEALVKADSKIHAVMAASILAKTERDAKMIEFAKIYPEYKYEKHKGYPTKEHKALLAKFGKSPIQRLTFKF
jgi:ribonuclease HII